MKRLRNFMEVWLRGEGGCEGSCVQNFPITPCALAEPELFKTALRASWKNNWDHLARLVSSNREDFAYYPNTKKKTIPLYAGALRVLPRLPASNPRGQLQCLYYYIRNFCNLIGLEQCYFSLIWNHTCENYKPFVSEFRHKYHSWYFKIVSNFSCLKRLDVKLRTTILKYHLWYLYQTSLQIMLLPIQIPTLLTLHIAMDSFYKLLPLFITKCDKVYCETGHYKVRCIYYTYRRLQSVISYETLPQ